MPLRTTILQSNIAPEDADLVESLFNQFSSQSEDDEQRRERASGLVRAFVDGERDCEKLIAYLIGAGPSGNHCVSGTPLPGDGVVGSPTAYRNGGEGIERCNYR